MTIGLEEVGEKREITNKTGLLLRGLRIKYYLAPEFRDKVTSVHLWQGHKLAENNHLGKSSQNVNLPKRP